MKERPILFSGPLVRAILEGRKTVTRRLVKPQPQYIGGAGGEDDPPNWGWETECGAFVVMGGDFRPYQGDAYSHTSESYLANCPHGAPGDRLWVRETYRFEIKYNSMAAREAVDHSLWKFGTAPARQFCEDLSHDHAGAPHWGKWRPSIFCCRETSRIDLEIVSVRAERLQDITARDVAAEGVDLSDIEGERPPDLEALAVARFAHLWDSINGKRPGASWADNPWVWAISFRRVRP